jgi:hypothetical protein
MYLQLSNCLKYWDILMIIQNDFILGAIMAYEGQKQNPSSNQDPGFQ